MFEVVVTSVLVPEGNPYGAAPTEYCQVVIPVAAAHSKLAVVEVILVAVKPVG